MRSSYSMQVISESRRMKATNAHKLADSYTNKYDTKKKQDNNKCRSGKQKKVFKNLLKNSRDAIGEKNNFFSFMKKNSKNLR